MKIIKQNVELISKTPYETVLQIIETAGRTCYKSEPNESFDEKRAEAFIKRILDSKHESVIEHQSLTFRITTNRAIANEITRHRIASYSQESTRYCNYCKDKFDNEITVIEPLYDDCGTNEKYDEWYNTMLDIEKTYLSLTNQGVKPDIVRGILPLDLKTELVVTMNFRALRHFISLRSSGHAHPQIREIAGQIYDILNERYPIFTTGLNM